MLSSPKSPAGTLGRVVVVLTLAACAAGLTVLAQEKPAADKPADSQVGGLRFVDVSEVTIVNVKVSVSDKRGPVLGLTKDAFEVYQDGKLQELTNFAFYSDAADTPAPAAATAPAPPAVSAPPPALAGEAAAKPEPLFITLYIDNENVLPLNRNRVLNRVTEFVHQYVKVPDRAMLVAYQRSLKVLQPFTSDPNEIVDALRKVKLYAGGRVSMISSRKEIEEAITDETKTNNDMERLYGMIRGFAQEQQTNLKFTVGSLKEIVTMMSGLPGRKVMVYVSDGLPMNPGLELYYELQSNYNDPGVLARSQDYESSALFRGLVTTAAAAGVTIHTIDCRGLDSELGMEAENRTARSTMGASVAMSNYQDTLVYMAEQTGGLAIINTNDVTAGLERIGRDMTTYYSLGYRLTPTGQDRAHRVQVKLKNKEYKDLRLNYTKTFIEKTLPTRVGDRVMSGLAFDLEDNPLGITLSAGEPSPSSGGRWLLPVEVRLPIDKIALVPDGDNLAGFLSVYYAARDNDGKQSDLQTTDHAVKIPSAEYATARATVFVVHSALLLEPGTYRISVGVRDQLTNQAGYAAMRKPVHPEKV